MFADELERSLSCPVERQRPLAPLTTLGVGGSAEYYVEPSRLEDLQAVCRTSARFGVSVHALGGGSNVLFADGLIPGVVLSMRKWNGAVWRRAPEGEAVVEAQAGHPLSAVLTEAVRQGLGGLEFVAGIPGTVGGAIAGSVGAGGRSVGEFMTAVTSLERDGSLREWQEGEFVAAYRSFSLTQAGRVFLGCRMLLHPAGRERIESELARFREARSAQPIGARSAGCSFKNPPGESAGRLLDRCGCKGMSVGGARVSERHANFIVNEGRATASDVLSLMQLCQATVLARTGVRLEPEVRVIGLDIQSAC
ncbi:UDP-N-acetylmuramate dehydrogenase [uncultured Fretibacterium sp.]|uniref:UDP-N-acetylmuramate dehydrogenase n=1 Tax=uncultured Fretibacterium sp. TaxID=1678694 RepID=UPI002606EF7A|nr:UDP-N-acetylmuramate dehydrogenase [uncultured Fretibacterium sp.]